MNKHYFLYTLLLLAACGCGGSKKKESGLAGLHHEYLVALGESSFLKAQCVATFRKGDDSGKPQELPPGYSVYFDSLQLPLDKSVYPSYGTELSRDGFNRRHNWSIKQDNNTVVLVSFEYRTFTTDTTIGPVLGTADIVVPINGLEGGDLVQCWFDNIDIDNDKDRFTYPVTNNAFTIKAADLQSLKAGDYKLKISYIRKSPIVIEGKESGILDLSYSLDDKPVTIKY